MVEQFVSYAQNGEDVVLARALRHVAEGRYIDVGANDPVVDSVTLAFYERGWSGITIEPVHEYAERQREERPRDLMVEAAITDEDRQHVVLHQFANTGLSTLVDEVSDRHRASGRPVEDVSVPARRLDSVLEEAAWNDLDIHLMVVDVEGAERQVLRSLDFHRWRPWIVLIEATWPQRSDQTHAEWQDILVAAGYRFCLFDGLSRYFVAEEKASELAQHLGAPANSLDNYVRHEVVVLARQRDDALARMQQHDEVQRSAIVRWRAAALEQWLTSTDVLSRAREQELLQEIHMHVSHIRHVDAQVESERAANEALRSTLSWRATKPLRFFRSLASRGRRQIRDRRAMPVA